jgi:hypothetical protein
MLGLNDAHIARLDVREDAPDTAGHEKGDGRYVLERAPDVILFIQLEILSRPLAELANWPQIVRMQAAGVSEREIANDRRFARDYRLYSVPLPEVGGYLNFFAHRSLAESLQLTSGTSSPDVSWPRSGGHAGTGAAPGFGPRPGRPGPPRG